MKKEDYIISNDIYYQGIVESIKKSKEQLQPVYEAFTNSLESLKLVSEQLKDKFIKIVFNYNKSLLDQVISLNKISIIDNGGGFDEENFNRLKRYKDTRKGFSNKGCGRIQFLHFFDTAEYISIFREKENLKKIKFILSKSKKFLSKNAIILLQSLENVSEEEPITSLVLKNLLDEKDKSFYDNLTADIIKEKFLSKYILEFCAHRDNLPQISIEFFINDEINSRAIITKEDIPSNDKQKDINLNYYTLSEDGKDFEKLQTTETLKLISFKISKQSLHKNEIKLSSKNEICDEPKIKFDSLPPTDSIDDNRYLFLISGKYIDKNDGDTRGNINIPTKKEFKKSKSDNLELFDNEVIFLDDIEEKVNKTILSLYDEIQEKVNKKQTEIKKLKEMFLLNEETVNTLTFGLDETEEKILEKVYTADVKITAQKDAEIKINIDKLESLDTTSDDYIENLENIIDDLVKAIPLQNRTSLTHYVARRKLILELFDKILKKQLEIQKKNNRNIDEKLLHNLIFQQTSNKSDKSDLWIINEEFIYFKGTSEYKLKDVEINGKKIFKEKLTEEEEKYCLSLEEDRTRKKPDVLLFPNEGKCIIIEFKNPDVNMSYHINQINNYAILIRNLTVEEFQFDTFYGYLIGEKIEPNEVRAHDADFKISYHLDYVFRPSKTVAGMFGRKDGSLYTEVIKYSTLLKRAQLRNEIFIKKLEK